MTPALLARLHKNDYRVLCGHVECGADIAVVVRYHVVDESSPDDEADIRVLCFEPGWYQREDGIWALSRHAQKDVKRAAGQWQPYPRYLRSRRGWMANGSERQTLRMPVDMPVLAQCWRCGHTQLLEFEALRASHVSIYDSLPDGEIDWPERWQGWEIL